MAYNRKIDTTHTAIVRALHKIPGAQVIDTHRVGQDFPDVVVGYQRRNVFVEIKSSEKSQITPGQFVMRQSWPGEYHIAWTPEMAVNAVIFGSVFGEKK